jgi:hypothetical protein
VPRQPGAGRGVQDPRPEEAKPRKVHYLEGRDSDFVARMARRRVFTERFKILKNSKAGQKKPSDAAASISYDSNSKSMTQEWHVQCRGHAVSMAAGRALS